MVDGEQKKRLRLTYVLDSSATCCAAHKCHRDCLPEPCEHVQSSTFNETTDSFLRSRSLLSVVDDIERKASSKDAVVENLVGRFLWEKPHCSSLQSPLLENGIAA